MSEPSTFVGNFGKYMRSRTDAPVAFHIHGAMVALAAALGNHVWCDGWSRAVYPNLWVVNIAPSGYGKSTTLDMAQNLLHQAQLGERVLPGAFSQEALTRRLVEQPSGVWFHQEFASFLGTLARDYNSGAMQWLTEIFDVPDEYPRILMKETFALKKPCVSILGASSPDWFAQAFHESSLRGGFLARFLFCPSSTPGPYIGHPGPRLESEESPLAGWLRDVAEMHGRADLSRVLPMFRDWDFKARRRVRDNCPPEFSGMRSRAGLLVLKAMMLFHVSDTTDNLVISEQDFHNAVEYVETSQRQAEQYLDEEVAHDKKEQQRMRLREVLRRGGGRRTWSEALKLSKFDRFEFKSAVDTLIESGMVELEREGRTQWLILRDAPIHQFTVKGRELVNSGNTNGRGDYPGAG